MKYAIGVDIGGTKISFVLLKNSRVIKTQKIVSPKNKKGIIETIEDNVKIMISNLPKSEILGIGLGVTGPLGKKRDVMLNPPNQKFLKGCPLAKILEQKLKMKTVMDNDVKCFTLGETLFGAGRGAEIVLGITLGTGLGSGLAINGKLYRGNTGAAGELGHMIIKFDGPKCNCGNPGCFEEYGSQRFFKKMKYSPKELGIRAMAGEEKSLKIFREYGRYLGIGLGNAINILDPEVIVLGGGIANVFHLFIKEARKQIKKIVISPLAKEQVYIKKSKLGDFAGAIGAACLLWENKK